MSVVFFLGERGGLKNTMVACVKVEIAIVIVWKQFAAYTLKIYITPERMRNL